MDTTAVDQLRTALLTVVVVAAPVLLVALLVGVLTALAQAATQVQDQAVSTVPKLVASALALLALAGWMVAKLVDFAQTMFAGGA